MQRTALVGVGLMICMSCSAFMLPVAAPSAAALVAGARTAATALFAETNDSVEDVDTVLDVSSRDWRAFR
jgi:hypothetical protein